MLICQAVFQTLFHMITCIFSIPHRLQCRRLEKLKHYLWKTQLQMETAKLSCSFPSTLLLLLLLLVVVVDDDDDDHHHHHKWWWEMTGILF